MSGLSPELKLYDDEGLLMQKVDIARKTTQQIHELLQSRGFKYEQPKDEAEEDLEDFHVREDI